MVLTQKQIEEIKEHLSKAQNPLFFFDNDQDGMCSFLLLQKYLGRGKGFPVKTSPQMTLDYFRKVSELNADYVFILDQPEVSQEFFEEVKKVNIPVVWIDHHQYDKTKIPAFVNYYNPLYNKGKYKGDEPVTFLCYQINNKKEDLWLAVAGCISDGFVPELYNDFKKIYPELCIDSKDSFDILYGSDIGKIARIFGFSLKDRLTNVILMLKYIIKSKNPYDILNENYQNKFMHKRFEEINKKYTKFINKAKEMNNSGKLIFFKYGGNTSISADIANGLKFVFPDKIIVVIYTKGLKANISARGKNIRPVILKAIEKLENATGGGHENAVGAQIRTTDINKFEAKIKSLI